MGGDARILLADKPKNQYTTSIIFFLFFASANATVAKRCSRENWVEVPIFG